MKAQREDLANLQEGIEQKLADLVRQINKKSNIKDVCALLDQKSNTMDINKALDDIHQEIDKSVATKGELNNAL